MSYLFSVDSQGCRYACKQKGLFFSNLVFLLTLLSFLKLHGQDLAAIHFRNAGFWLTSSTPVLVLFCSSYRHLIFVRGLCKRVVKYFLNTIQSNKVFTMAALVCMKNESIMSKSKGHFLPINIQYSPLFKILNTLPTL